MSENRIQQLIDAGVAKSPSDFSHEARQVINALAVEEFQCLLTIRAKVYTEGGEPAGHHYDSFICLFV